MKKFILAGLVLGVTFVSCKKSTETIPEISEEILAIEKGEVQDMQHSSKNSLDWFGTYDGLLPCADCEAIKTTITLTFEGKFVYTAEYLNKGFIVENSGEIIWSESGNKITLKDGESFNMQLKVVENALIQLDEDGNLIEGVLAEHYKLHKLN